MERETKKSTTPKGVSFELLTYITAGERNGIRDSFAGISGGGEDVTAKNQGEAEKVFIEGVVFSLDGKKEDIYKRMLDFSPKEYDFIVSESVKCIQELSDFLTPEK